MTFDDRLGQIAIYPHPLGPFLIDDIAEAGTENHRRGRNGVESVAGFRGIRKCLGGCFSVPKQSSSAKLIDTTTGEQYSTWFFVMTLAFSRHQYVEMVKDQKIATWLGCHRRAFEFFAGVPAKVMIDNLKAGITKACWHDPVVQRSYAECAEGYGFLISPCPPRDPKKKDRARPV